MKLLLVLSAFITLVASQSDPLNTFLYHLEEKVQETNAASCKNMSLANPVPEDQMQSFDECIQYSNEMTTKLMSNFDPIAKKIVEDARLNIDGRYYEWDQTKQVWYLPNNAITDYRVDGLQENAKKMAYELDLAFKMLVQSQSSTSLKKRAPTVSNVKVSFANAVKEVAQTDPKIDMQSIHKNVKARKEALDRWAKNHPNKILVENNRGQVMKELIQKHGPVDKQSIHKNVKARKEALDRWAKNHAKRITEANKPPKYKVIATKILATLSVSALVGSLIMFIIAIVAVKKLGRIEENVAKIAQNTPTSTSIERTLLPSALEETAPTPIDESAVDSLELISEPLAADEASSPTPLAKFDETTGTTYYYDQETKYWYFWDEEKQNYEWFSE